MKIALVFVLACVAVLSVSAAPQYTTKYDNIDLDQILTSERLLKNYFNCLMERGTCTPDGKELKEHLPDAISNECATCNEKQKTGAKKVIRFLVKNKPELWTELTAKYDPEGKHKARFDEEFKKEDSE